MRTLQDKVVVITGAGSGFGRALALEVARRKGLPVLLDVNEQGLRETAGLVTAMGARCAHHKLDVRDGTQWAAVTKAVIDEFGRADVLINNAGVLSRAESFLEVTEEHGRFVFDVNLWGMFNGTRALVPYLARQPEAALVNIASSLALIASPMHSVYCASKAAIASFTSVVRQELAGGSVTVSVVFPGPSKTNLGRNIPTQDRAKVEEDAKNFEKYAVTTPETVARRIINGILRRQHVILTSADGRLMQFFHRVAPGFGHYLMGKVYRRISDPKLFQRLGQLGQG